MDESLLQQTNSGTCALLTNAGRYKRLTSEQNSEKMRFGGEKTVRFGKATRHPLFDDNPRIEIEGVLNRLQFLETKRCFLEAIEKGGAVCGTIEHYLKDELSFLTKEEYLELVKLAIEHDQGELLNYLMKKTVRCGYINDNWVTWEDNVRASLKNRKTNCLNVSLPRVSLIVAGSKISHLFSKANCGNFETFQILLYSLISDAFDGFLKNHTEDRLLNSLELIEFGNRIIEGSKEFYSVMNSTVVKKAIKMNNPDFLKEILKSIQFISCLWKREFAEFAIREASDECLDVILKFLEKQGLVDLKPRFLRPRSSREKATDEKQADKQLPLYVEKPEKDLHLEEEIEMTIKHEKEGQKNDEFPEDGAHGDNSRKPSSDSLPDGDHKCNLSENTPPKISCFDKLFSLVRNAYGSVSSQSGRFFYTPYSLSEFRDGKDDMKKTT